MQLNPHITFHGEAREAMEFYRSVLGGELLADTYGSHPGLADPGASDLVMHAELVTPHGLVLMASDWSSMLPYSAPASFAVSLSGDDAHLLGEYWAGLLQGGTEIAPLEEARWGGRFGMLVDRFGIIWHVSQHPMPAGRSAF